MATTVLILGAGASKKAGAPLMAEFLDVAHELWKTGQVSDEDGSFQTVFKGLGTLQRVHSKSQLDIQNVESVFASFEMARTLGRFVDYPVEEIPSLVESMRTVIVRTIEKTLVFPVRSTAVMPPSPYEAFSHRIQVLRENARPRQKVAVITFNYDLAIDYSLLQRRIPIDYALGPESSDGNEAVPVLKLHGSINWGWCNECRKTIAWMMKDYLVTANLQVWPETTGVRLPVGSQLATYKAHGHDLEGTPVIIPPTWNKAEYRRNLESVWSRAAHELADAENIFVFGYSMPPTDEFFRFLYALGTVGETPLKRFWVFDPDQSGKVQERFAALLGPGAARRFLYFPMPFHEGLAQLSKVFPVTE